MKIPILDIIGNGSPILSTGSGWIGDASVNEARDDGSLFKANIIFPLTFSVADGDFGRFDRF
jgi:hypothetical protein